MKPANDQQKRQTADWSALFPEFEGCERTLQTLTKNGETLEQTAVYKPRNPENSQPPVYYGCGSITLRVAPSARKTANEVYEQQQGNPFFRKLKVKNFEAYSRSPMCGNDDWRGSLDVYFDEDKVLIVNAKIGAGDILKYAETADYGRLKKTLDDFYEK